MSQKLRDSLARLNEDEWREHAAMYFQRLEERARDYMAQMLNDCPKRDHEPVYINITIKNGKLVDVEGEQ